MKILALVSAVLLVSDVNCQESQDAMAKTIEFENDSDGIGQYKFKFVTSNEIVRSESGRLEEDGNYVVEGYYSFIANDGKKYYVSYHADKTGYHPTVIDSKQPFLIEEQFLTKSALPAGVVASLLGG